MGLNVHSPFGANEGGTRAPKKRELGDRLPVGPAGARQYGRNGLGIGSVTGRGRVEGIYSGTRWVDEGRCTAAANTVSRESFGHVNVDNLDASGL